MDSTQQTLITAARTEFLQHGYKAASIADIAARAGLAVGSVYKFFPSKQALFFEVYFTENARAKQQIAAAIDWSNPRQALKEFITKAAETSRDNQILQAWTQPGIGDQLKRECLGRCETGEFRDFLHRLAEQWRAAGSLPADYGDDFLEELLELANHIDARLPVSQAAKTWLIEALVEKLFPEV